MLIKYDRIHDCLLQKFDFSFAVTFGSSPHCLLVCYICLRSDGSDRKIISRWQSQAYSLWMNVRLCFLSSKHIFRQPFISIKLLLSDYNIWCDPLRAFDTMGVHQQLSVFTLDTPTGKNHVGIMTILLIIYRFRNLPKQGLRGLIHLYPSRFQSFRSSMQPSVFRSSSSRLTGVSWSSIIPDKYQMIGLLPDAVRPPCFCYRVIPEA